LLPDAEERPAVAAAEQEGEAVQVVLELRGAVGGVANVVQQRCGKAAGVAGEPAV
jgi:hypothetical protein